MKEENDAQLINDILSGDDTAFNTLVQRYQKSIHALAWRKIGDFHFAEEITQDTFLKAYENLSTLKDPNQFAGWLYVIANRLCINWSQRNKSPMQSLEDIPMGQIEQSSYTHYVSEQREARATEERYDRVKKLLEKLPESERTVLTLYYLGEMTTKEIGKFLGVSVNTITSRLQRARRRLQEDQEHLIQEVLGGVHISTGLSQNIMRRVADMKPKPSPAPKPFLPWIALGTAIVVIGLMLGTSNQYLVHFQKPYSFEAVSEPTIEIVDAPVTQNIESKPAVRTQTGSVATPSENNRIGLQAAENILAPNTQQNPFRSSASQWAQASGPQGSHISEIFVTSKGDLYTATATGIYTLTTEQTAWTLINTSIPTGYFPMPMAEYGSTVYVVSADEIFALTDSGETWNALGPRPKGHAIGLIITRGTQDSSSQVPFTMYLALRDKGVFYSKDAGTQWKHLNNGLTSNRIYAVAAIRNTVFVGTNEGVYRLNSDTWEQLPVDVSNAVHSLAVMNDTLYVGTGSDPFALESSNTKRRYTVQAIARNTAKPWKIFRSTDLGMSWSEITPKNKPSVVTASRSIKILVKDKTLLALDDVCSFHSKNGGQTWTNIGYDADLVTQNIFLTAAVDGNTFYKVNEFGVHQTIDGGNSWHPFMEGMIGTKLQNLIAFNDRLYVHTGNDILQSTNGGRTWKSVRLDAKRNNLESIGQEQFRVNFYFGSNLVAAADGGLYIITPDIDKLNIFRLSTGDNIFIPVQEIPVFDEETLSTELWIAIAKAERVNLPDGTEKNTKVIKALRSILTFAVPGGFVVSGETFYVERQRRLFKWKPGEPEWTNTGLIDLGKQPDGNLRKEFKLAASGETLYVGKRAGELFQSLDGGNSWIDITLSLPLRFTHFNEIIFAGSTVYVATDKGVLSSQNGKSWRVPTDGKGTHIVIDRFAIDHTTIYGAGDTGVYRLDTHGRWEQISPNVPDKVISLVINNDKLYVATQHRGMFHISLEQETVSQTAVAY